jgi:D-beta-D-heptose 7-phosphate kinase/D-beta-D-heptose 1-phosphate adenosyltransferase
MSAELLPWVDAFARLRVAVIGEAMLDVYLEGAVVRFCQEAPVPVVALEVQTCAPGGAGNTAVNVHDLGGG